MSPRILLILVSISIIILNILTIHFREKKAEKLETRLRLVAKRRGEPLTLEEISKDLDIHVYDARILTRKFMSSGKMTALKGEDEKEPEQFIFKS